VNDALGLNLQGASSQVTGATTLCTYAGGSPGPVTISFQTGENTSTFAAGKSAVEQTGETATDVPDLGDAAYSYAKGSGESEQSSLAVLKGSIEIVVTAPVQIDDVDALARQVLTSV
jgi:hypothetical protein